MVRNRREKKGNLVSGSRRQWVEAKENCKHIVEVMA